MRRDADGRRTGKRHSILRSLAVLFMGSHMLIAAATEAGDSRKWGPYIDLEGKLGSKRNIGEADIFLPIAQDNRTLYFANVRARLDDGSDREGSIGLGVRRMLENGWNVGAYGFVDHRRTTYNNTFKQTTVGFEALGRDIDWRANIYTPFGDKSRTLSSSDVGSISSGSLFVSTTVQEERALPGFDLEAGWRLPLFDAEDKRQVRLYLAGYRFSDEGIKVQGTRIRAEYMLAAFGDSWKGAQLTLGAEYQDDNARGAQSFVGLRLRIPLGATGSSLQRLNAQERRMLASIERDVDIVSQIQSRTLQTEKATTTIDGQSIAGISGDDTTGANLQSAINTAGANSTVVLAGSFNTTTITQLLNGQTVMGAGTLKVRTTSGREAVVTLPGATIVSNVTGNVGAVNMADNSTLSGMNIVHQDPNTFTSNPIGIYALNVNNVRILNNMVTATSTQGTAFGIRVENSTNVTIGNNTIIARHTTANAVALQFVGGSGTVYGNSLDAVGANVGNSYAMFFVDSSGTNPQIFSGSVGNTLVHGMCLNNGGGPVAGTVYFTNGTHCP